VVLKDGATFDAAAIREFARAGLTPYKVPRRVVQADDLPRSLIGKVLRRQVRNGLLEG
jgi:long-chain acyl-CoA synthetase